MNQRMNEWMNQSIEHSIKQGFDPSKRWNPYLDSFHRQQTFALEQLRANQERPDSIQQGV